MAEKQAREGKIGFWADNTCQGNTTQGVAGEAAKATVPPIGGTQEKTQIPKEEIQTAEGIIKKSTAGICHSTLSKSYTKTKKYKLI